jgi:hypothetical protein
LIGLQNSIRASHSGLNEMSEFHIELLEIADRLEPIAQQAESSEFKESLDRLEEATTKISKAWSGSWLGYHARVYYKNLKPPPSGAQFSPEWSMMDTFTKPPYAGF